MFLLHFYVNTEEVEIQKFILFRVPYRKPSAKCVVKMAKQRYIFQNYIIYYAFFSFVHWLTW